MNIVFVYFLMPMKEYSFIAKDLLTIEKQISTLPSSITITGDTLTIPDILAVAKASAEVSLTSDSIIKKRIRDCYDAMMKQIEDGIPIYGCNTGYGAQASHILTNGTPDERIQISREISQSLVHVDVSTGPVFEKEITRAAMTIRINMLMKGVSGVKFEDLELFKTVLNANITPIVNQYGGIGASGDLAHNSRVLSVLRQLDGVKVWDSQGNIRPAKEVLREANINPLILDPKAGLAFVNGDNFSTALATILATQTLQLFVLSTIVGAMTIEVLRGTNRSFHPMVSAIRPHPGQVEIASIFRYLLDGSSLAYQEMAGHTLRPEGVKVQDGYSLRCIQQYHGGNVDRIKQILDTITINANSASDNPLWVSPEYTVDGEEPWHWVSGGNFLAMHMAESMDQLRKIMTQIVKITDRHLARLVNPDESNGLPPNLSDKEAISQCAFKGIQIQSGMFDVYSTLLSMPVTTMFGTHEENNQDITSHALTSGILGLDNIRLVRYSLAQTLIALAQAVDLRGGGRLLSPKTRPMYEFIRNKVSYMTKERPMHEDIENLYTSIVDGSIFEYTREHIFANYRF